MFADYNIVIMHENLLLKLSIGLLYIFGTVEAQSCPCDRGIGNFSTVWGNWVEGDERSECVGECNKATQERIRTCEIFQGNRNMSVSIPCEILVPCDSCKGEWSQWGNFGLCSVGCGIGIQRMQRFCYEVSCFLLSL